MNKRMTARGLSLLLLAVMLVVAGCSSSTNNSPGNGGTGGNSGGNSNATGENNNGAETSGWTGTITMYAQSYTPNAKNISGINAEQQMLQVIADEYEKLHPGIKIEFVDEEFKDYTQTVRVKAAAGELFDIFWGQWAELNDIFPKGIAEDLKVYFDAPNPYIPDKATWRESMNQTVINETASADGKHYNINGDYVATAFFYNKDLFEQAGITAAPTTWAELIDVSKKLEAAGIVPMSQAPDFGWFVRHFLTDFYSAEFDTIAGYDSISGVSSLDQSVAIAKGLLSTEDERFMGWWPMFKELTDTWKKDYITGDPGVVASSARNDFLAGKTAIHYDGSWLPNYARDAKVTFTLGSFNFPTLSSADIPFSTGEDTSGAVGGPNAAFQFAIATKEANASMKEAGKQEAVVDWLQFLGTPANVERVVNEKGTFIPTWPGTTPNESMIDLASQASKELRAITVGGSSPNMGKNLQRIFGLYLSGNMSFEEAEAAVAKELDAAIKEYQTKNNEDLSKY